MLEVLSALEVKQSKGVQKCSWKFSNFASIIQVGFTEKVKFHRGLKRCDRVSNTISRKKNIRGRRNISGMFEIKQERSIFGKYKVRGPKEKKKSNRISDSLVICWPFLSIWLLLWDNYWRVLNRKWHNWLIFNRMTQTVE